MVADVQESMDRLEGGGYDSFFDEEPKSPVEAPRTPPANFQAGTMARPAGQGPHPTGPTHNEGPSQVDQQIQDLADSYGLTPDQLRNLIMGDGGDGGTGGGGGGGGGGGMSYAEQMENAQRSQLMSTYMQLWGETPPQAVIDNAIARGLNVYQFEDEQRADPSFAKTEVYQDEYAAKALAMARMMGFRP